MTEEARAILDAARKLPPEQQILIAETLLDEVADDGEDVTEEEFLAELNRRADEAVRGIDKGIPWREVLRGEQ